MDPARFELVSDFAPCGDQPAAIAQLVEGLAQGRRDQVLLGITGSGKTFTIANVIQQVQRPTLVIAHNKTLAAQLYGEFRQLFPSNGVYYFVSYYDYYQPEAYVPASDTYIEKDAMINDDIDRLRHAATQGLLSRDDVIIVASVSCIFGIGDTEHYRDMMIELHRGQVLDRDRLLASLVEIQYERNDYDFHRGVFRVRGDVVEIFPANEEERALRVEFFGDEIEGLWDIDPLRGQVLGSRERMRVFPSTHYVTPADQLRRAALRIRDELVQRLTELRSELNLLAAQRLEQRTLFDLEMLEQMGYCTGIENYARHLSGRDAGQPPPTLLDYFPRDFLLVIDESHQTIPQLQAMYRGDQSRKQTLVDHGFRLPSAMDNRPLKFEEFVERIHRAIFVSATPGPWELARTQGVIVEQILRPTGLLDPQIEVRPVSQQVDDLVEEIRLRVSAKQRVLVTTLTKRMAEDLTEHYQDLGIAARYLHADIDTLERVKILNDLRSGAFDVLIGINLLREGLDLPEVSLVAILDADKEGFLRTTSSLIQTMGRASRNADGKVIMYGDTITPSMARAIEQTERRRTLQQQHNAQHGIVPRTIQRAIVGLGPDETADPFGLEVRGGGGLSAATLQLKDFPVQIEQLRKEMNAAATQLDFERAALLRDQIHQLTQQELLLREPEPRRARKTAARRAKAARSRITQ